MTARSKILLASIAIIALVSLSTASIAIYALYRVGFQTHRNRLVEVVQSRARIIEAIARFDAKFSRDDVPGGPGAATLGQVIDAHEQFEGFGRTGEFTLARRRGDEIVWLLRHRHQDSAIPEPTPFDSQLAEPMRRALNGESGSVVRLDYRGATVLAAYEEIRGLNWGVVAKIDIEEIREPFLLTGSIVAGIAILTIAVGVAFVVGVTSPLLGRIERRSRDLKEAHARARVQSSEAMLAVERERRKLAVDLHDGLGQLLAIAKMKLGMLRESGKASGADSEVREVEDLINKAHQRSGEVTFQLCPPVLYDVGLVQAFEWLADDLDQRYGLQVTVEVDGQPGPLDEETRISLFRSMNELLINVIKHAKVDAALVRIGQEDRSMTIAVEDEGVGFDSESNAASYGLFSVRERLHHLGGTVQVDSITGRGTRVVLVVPVSHAGEEERKESA
jgi:signal transduction histidine kinase